MSFGGPIVALLGPTNTGKTHRAIERMLEHASGMMGLPLRLLAREVYDRVAARVGERRVALVTGEEKRIPPRPDYWICTVEAMPVDHEVDFLAIDEIQLAAHEQRGHVFTDRLLHARGRNETWFLGAETMRERIAELVPAARILDHPRLSRLTHAGAATLQRLPPRSAIVAFSMPQVYELAERLRHLRGGAAVVLGALSPRTRNAQVAMFQAGEVDYLVATDAIGMGLNLDVRHVAFAGLRKFDGKDGRELEAAELAQIAGRAGRWIHDGTFGTVTPVALPFEHVRAIEAHAFPKIRRLRWRSHELDTSSPHALLASLRARSPRATLALAHDAEDTLALERLLEDDAVVARARGPIATTLLWEVCGVPDFRKLLFEAHVALLRELFFELVGPTARLSASFLGARIDELDDDAGEADTLIARMAAVRTWTYVSGKADWVEDARYWQERTRAIEDKLSDALHERLVQRFVNQERHRPRHGPSRPRARRPHAADPVFDDRGPRTPFHDRLRALRQSLPDAPPPSETASDFAQRLVNAEPNALRLEERAMFSFEGRAVARLTRGPTILLPEARLLELEGGAGATARMARRLMSAARDLVTELLEPLRVLDGARGTNAPRGVLYAVEQGLGSVRVAAIAHVLATLRDDERAALEGGGLVLGRVAVFHPALLERDAIERRGTLAAVFYGAPLPIATNVGSALSLRVSQRVPRAAYEAMGFLVFGERAVRVDVVERVATHVARGDKESDRSDSHVIASWMGCSAREASAVVAQLAATQ